MMKPGDMVIFGEGKPHSLYKFNPHDRPNDIDPTWPQVGVVPQKQPLLVLARMPKVAGDPSYLKQRVTCLLLWDKTFGWTYADRLELVT